MSLLLEIRTQLEEASARILEMERALRDDPEDSSTAANLRSAVRIRSRLESQFNEAAEKAGYDICCYRAFDDQDQPDMVGALGAIADFQRLVSVVYGAIKHGQKKLRATVPEDVARETAFGFGYAFTGSIGVVLTARNQKMLFDSVLDDSLDTVFSMAKSGSGNEVLAHADRLGRGPINALYQWVERNAEHNLGVEVEWRKGNTKKKTLLVQWQEIEKLRTTIEGVSSKAGESTGTYSGILMMVDVTKKRFSFKREGIPEISGTYDPAVIDMDHTATLPKAYTATIRRTIWVSLSTGKKQTRHHLLKLVPSTSKKNADEHKEEFQL